MSPLTDLSYIDEIADGDPEFKSELIKQFLEQTPEFINNIILLCKDKKWGEAGKIAHKFKPTLMYVGLSDANRKMQKVEIFCETGIDTDKIEGIVRDVENTCRSAYPELKEALTGLITD